MTATTPTFEVIDYCVFAAVILISFVIGGFLSYKGSKSPDEYFLGNRQFNVLPMSISMVTSYVSAISILGVTGELYAHGSKIMLVYIGYTIGIIFASVILLPVFHPLKLTSVNEYIQKRFKSTLLTTCISLLYCIRTILYAGLCLYAPTIALVAVSPFDYMTYIWLLGVICTLYSALGGIRAVVWTDVFQCFFMITGIIIIVILAIIELGGLGKTWSIASKGGRLDLLSSDTSIYVRHTLYNLIITGSINAGSSYGVNQIYVQRLCSVNSVKNARRVLRNTFIGSLFVYLVLFIGGISFYAIYADCDPMARGLIKQKEGILPFLILDRLNYITGLPGLFVATLIGGTLSTVSSVINAIGALLWRDVLWKMTYFKKGSNSLAVVANKSLSLITGCLCIGTAMLFSKAGGLMQIVLSLMGVFAGPILAVFLLGVLFPRCNYKGALAGLLLSFILVAWTSLGALFYASKPAILPLSTEKCSTTSEFHLNATYVNATGAAKADFTQYSEENPENNFPLMWLYGISYTFYGFIGMISCFVTAFIVSFLTGWQDLDEVPPECISPFIRKFYWKEDQQIGLKHQAEEYKVIEEIH